MRHRALHLLIAATLSIACSGGDESSNEMAVPEVRSRSLLTPASDNRLALLIGIGTYPSPSETLLGPPTDVAQVRSLLERNLGFRSENVLTLIDREATREAIINAVRTHLSKAGPNGLIVLYYSGHGTGLTVNLSVDDPEPVGDQALRVWNEAGNATTIILDDELGFLIRQLRAQRRIVIIDACFSGSAMTIPAGDLGDTPTRSPHPSQIQLASWGEDRYTPGASAEFTVRELRRTLDSPDAPFVMPDSFVSDGGSNANGGRGIGAELPDHVLLSASRDNERAYDAKNWPTNGEHHGLFTYFLVKELQRPNTKETFQQMFARLANTVRNHPVCTRRNACQTPSVSGTHAASRIGSFFASEPAP